MLTDWMVVAPAPGERQVDVERERSSPALRDIYRLMRAGRLAPPVLPASLPLGQLAGVTIPWLPESGA